MRNRGYLTTETVRLAKADKHTSNKGSQNF